MSELQDLLARVEAATGADRELDRDLAVDLLGWCLHPRDRQRDDSAQSDTGYTCLDCGADSWGNTGPTGQKRHASVPDLTASLDAALALVERVLPATDGWAWGVGNNPMIVPSLNAEAWVRCYDARRDNTRWETRGHTPALALLAALLKALIAQEATP